jgi:DNA invertase Pin-like site-specific DNA recombinase
MKTYGYTRVSTDKQEFEKQEFEILQYANKLGIKVDEFYSVQISSTASQKERKIEDLLQILQPSDRVLIVEISRLGRNLREIFELVNKFIDKGVKLDFIRQPELSTTDPLMAQLLIAFYGYVSQTEKKLIQDRTRNALATLRSRGVKLGRPSGSANKSGLKLDEYKSQIQEYVKIGLSVASIMKVVNYQRQAQVQTPLSFNTYKSYVAMIKAKTVSV